MSLSKNQSGFSIAEALLVLIVVVLLGLAGYFVFIKQQASNTDNSNQQSNQSVAGEVPSAPVINSTSDLTKAEEVLNQDTEDSGNDSKQLDNELSAF